MTAAPTTLAPTDPARGLSEAEVVSRRAAGLNNTPPPPTTRTYTQIVRENVFTFINNVLFLLGIALAAVGRPFDAVVSLAVISTNIVVSVVQETRAKRMLDAVALLHRPTASVIRDGTAQEVGPEQLVVGDLLAIVAGDQIVLDGRLVNGKIQADESQLTGESNLMSKTVGDEVFSGSFAVTGAGRYIAEKVGNDSFANQVTAGARTFRRVLTPLQREVYVAIRVVLLIVVYLEVMVVLNGFLKASKLADTVSQASILAGLVPNGLFVSIAIAYALAAVRILRYGALVQQSNAVESLSHVDVLCLDKTGTLTANRLSFDALHPLAATDAELRRRLGAAVASGSAGNKTSEAIAAGLGATAVKVTAEIPFSSARKWSAVAFDDPDAPGGRLTGTIALGAPTYLQPFCTADGQDGRPTWEQIEDQVQALAREGLRVLLVVGAPGTAIEDKDDDSTLPAGMTPLGLVTLKDELRPEAREALAEFAKAGVSPRIISGDDPETVTALARQAGLGPELVLLSGPEIDRMADHELRAAVEVTTIFGRITPQQKERLVDTLRANGHYVAMIGDGVNDVLPLKKANLGIAMQSGSQATRGVADLILTNDSFAALAPAVLEGQRIRNGMQDILKLFMTRISTVALLIVSSMIVGLFPISIRNGSAVTLMTVGIPTVLLVLWAKPGPAPDEGLVRSLLRFVAPAAVLSSLGGLVAFYATMEMELGRLDPGLDTTAALAAALPIAQTAVTAFLIAVGLFLVIFVEPPTAWWTGGDTLSGDWKPTIMAVVMLLAIPLLIVASMMIGLFPISIRNSSAVTLMTVGIPTVMLVLWARPGRGPSEGLTRSLVRFVAPAAILSSLAGLLVFYVALEVEQGRLESTMDATQALAGALPIAQTAVTAFLIAVGLFLVIFVEPPTPWWTGGDDLAGDWKPTIMAVVLLLAIPVLVNVPLVNDFFQLEPLRPEYSGLIIAVTAVWVLAVRLFWRHRLLERFLDAG